MIKSIVLRIALATLIVGCNSSSLKRRLTGADSTFWDNFDRKRGYITGAYCFNSNGSWQYYTNKNGHREKLHEGDVVYNHLWSVAADTILNLGDGKMTIFQFKDDTLILRNERAGDTLLLIKAPK